jgi:hypothetical protein
MRRSERRLFISALVSGVTLRLGLPGLGNLITLAWDTVRPRIEAMVSAELQIAISLISFMIFFVALYFTLEIYLKGVTRGRKGLTIVIAGVAIGFVVTTLAMGIAYNASSRTPG